ncbi:MAG: 3-deoxy-D-manno-octulosonic acid transferase, partial [Betaproteobacteria bacterium]
MRHVYTLLWLVALPLMPLRLWWRGRREPGYRTFVGERFGVYRSPVDPSQTGLVWIHAVSLGETRAVAPLIERLRREMPDQRILLTHMTATGREAGRALYGTEVVQAWLPYDVPFAVRGFLAHFRPRAGLLVETELWPNVVAESSRAGVALFLVNARLSERSARRYARITSLSAPMFRALKGTAAQSDADARRLADAGAIRVAVTGNLKFDVAVPAAERQRGRELRAQFGAARPVLLLASTRDGEEALLLDAYARSRDILPKSLLLVVVPRHPQRFDA